VIRHPLLTALACSAGLFAAAPATASSGATKVEIRATVHLVPARGATLVQKGTFSGAPLGRGSVTVRTTIGAGRGAKVAFVMSNRRGTARGTGNCAVEFKGTQIIYHGTAQITGGTGAFRGLRVRGLKVSGHGDIAGESFIVDVASRTTG
jgi:hypothetical protein